MTNEKVIAQLKDMQKRCTNGYDAEAIYFAIKALEDFNALKSRGNILESKMVCFDCIHYKACTLCKRYGEEQ